MNFFSYVCLALIVSAIFGALVGYEVVKDGGNNGEFYDEEGNVSFRESWYVVLFFSLIPLTAFTFYAIVKFLLEQVGKR